LRLAVPPGALCRVVDFATCFELAALARDGGVIDLSRLGDGAIGQIGPGFSSFSATSLRCAVLKWRRRSLTLTT